MIKKLMKLDLNFSTWKTQMNFIIRATFHALRRSALSLLGVCVFVRAIFEKSSASADALFRFFINFSSKVKLPEAAGEFGLG